MTATELETAIDLLRLAAAYDVAADWEKAMADANDHLWSVLRNNIGTPMWQVMARPDVKQAMREPFLGAAQRTIAQVMAAWQGDPNDPELARIVKTVNHNAVAARAAIKKAATKDLAQMDVNLQALGKKMGLQAQYAVQNSDKKSATLVKIQGHEGDKIWWGPHAQCSTCQALHGTKIPAGEEFDANIGPRKLATYGPLMGPPRHPSCTCQIKLA